jgi:hypothetical protein
LGNDDGTTAPVLFFKSPPKQKSITSWRLIETKTNRSGRKTTRTVISCQTRQSYHSKLAKERKEFEKHLNNDHQHSAAAATKDSRALLCSSWFELFWLVVGVLYIFQRKEEKEVCSFLLLPHLTRATLRKRIEIWPTV